MKNGREHVAHTHSIDKCFHKQSAEKNKNGKMKNKDSTNKDSMHKKQLLMLTETINNILNADETIPKKKGKINRGKTKGKCEISATAILSALLPAFEKTRT